MIRTNETKATTTKAQREARVKNPAALVREPQVAVLIVGPIGCGTEVPLPHRAVTDDTDSTKSSITDRVNGHPHFKSCSAGNRQSYE